MFCITTGRQTLKEKGEKYEKLKGEKPWDKFRWRGCCALTKKKKKDPNFEA